MNKFYKLILFIGLVLSITAKISVGSNLSKNLKNKLAVGLGYPYLALKYHVSSKLAFETRGTTGSDIVILGVRTFYNFQYNEICFPYVGLETDYITFNRDITKGTGYLLCLFVGGEYFIKPRFSFVLDIGPVYTRVVDKDNKDMYVDGTDWVVNLGLNYYVW